MVFMPMLNPSSGSILSKIQKIDMMEAEPDQEWPTGMNGFRNGFIMGIKNIIYIHANDASSGLEMIASETHR